MADDDAPQLIKAGPAWRVAFATGFLDGDSGRLAVSIGWWYLAGFKTGRRFRARRAA